MKYKKLFFLSLLILALVTGNLQNVSAQSYGLMFASHEVVPEQRTSLDLTSKEPVCFSNSLDLSFELSFMPNSSIYFGYVFRLINEKNQNIDLLYDQKEEKFHLVTEETFTDINFKIDTNILSREWTKFNFIINPNGVTCSVNNKVWQSKNLSLKSKCFKVLFGISNEHNFVSRDVPPMKLKNIAMGIDGKNKHLWTLNESAGSLAKDRIGNRQGTVLNPVWIQPRYNNWQMIESFSIKGSASLAFNAGTEEMYIVSTDSFYTIPANDRKLTGTPLSELHSNLLNGNQSIFNIHGNKLYNFYPDQKAVAAYNFSNRAWDKNFRDGPSTEFWQVNKFLSGDNSLYILCGYGQLKYKNTIQKYATETKEWKIIQPQGDFLSPRYLSALGATTSGDTAYIVGGFGSKEGDQFLSPRPFYDMLMYDVKKNTFKKLYTFSEPQEQFVFGNSLILDSDKQSYYALIFPNNRFNSNLQLIKGSLRNPSYKLMGQSFPYSFRDVRSFADLFYCKKNSLLLAATLYTTKENITEVKVYSINFPPNEINISDDAEKTNTDKESSFSWLYATLAACIAILIIAYFLIKKSRAKKYQALAKVKTEEPETNTIPSEPDYTEIVEMPAEPEVINTKHGEEILDSDTEPARTGIDEEVTLSVKEDDLLTPKSRIMLFGNFEVITAEGNNITRHFTPLLKEMFLLILINSLRYNKGVSAEKLNESLWNNKDIKDAKNNRSVNLVKLKNLLDKLSGCTINRETGTWKFEYDPLLIYVDFVDYLHLFFNTPSTNPLVQAGKLMEIVKAGGFLQENHYEWLDSIKAEISNFVIELLLKYSETFNIHTEPEKIIALSNAIFSFDELNEHALKLKCRCLIALGRHTLAKATFTKFSLKYSEIYGEEYSEPYSSLFAH